MSELSNLPRQSGAEYPHEGLDNFFTDPNWKQFAIRLAQKIGAYPNRLYFNDNEKLGAAVAFRGVHELVGRERGGDQLRPRRGTRGPRQEGLRDPSGE